MKAKCLVSERFHLRLVEIRGAVQSKGVFYSTTAYNLARILSRRRDASKYVAIRGHFRDIIANFTFSFMRRVSIC